MVGIQVHKFGGTSVADADCIRAAANLIAERRENASLVVVSSATAGTTDQLVAFGDAARQDRMTEANALMDALLERHLDILRNLEDGVEEVEIAQQIRSHVDVARKLGWAVGIQRELTPRVKDRILITGEKIAIRLFALALRKLGVMAEPFDADEFLLTDDNFGEANALPREADESIRGALSGPIDENIVPVVTGFCGRSPDGATTTLGRGGSDLSATILGAALNAEEVVIWTDVDGVMSADPRVVPGAQVIRQLHYREAAEMSFYGAKVLHQRTMIPVQAKKIPVCTRNTHNPSAPGTVVDGAHTPGSHPVKAVSAVPGHALLSIEGKGMAGVSGFSARLFGAIARQNISVTMYTQSSSEASICLALPEPHADRASTAIRAEFELEFLRGEVEEIAIERGVALLAVVGIGMAHTPGVAGRVTQALAKKGINIRAIAQGSSEINITLAVDSAQTERALRVLHHDFGLHRIDTGVEKPDGLNLILFGAGNIGRALVRLVLERSAHIAKRFGLDARIIALADTSGYILEPNGISSERLLEIIAAKEGGHALSKQLGGVTGSPHTVVEEALRYRLTRPVLVDTSGAEDAHTAFAKALTRGCDVVTANKIPLAGDYENFTALERIAREQGRLLKAEATVGAGLPVLDTLEMLLGTGDRLHRAEGCLSGTLSFVMSRLEDGASIKDSVAEAHRLGYTEADPAIDLTGIDVARKATILGRISGLAGSDVNLELEGLVPQSWTGLPFDELLEKLETLDEGLRRRQEEARKEGRVLRYVAVVESNSIKVGPMAVPIDSPVGRRRGTENLILFKTDRYLDDPLVIIGPGAGIEVTAMGVLGDILRVAAERM